MRPLNVFTRYTKSGFFNQMTTTGDFYLKLNWISHVLYKAADKIDSDWRLK